MAMLLIRLQVPIEENALSCFVIFRILDLLSVVFFYNSLGTFGR